MEVSCELHADISMHRVVCLLDMLSAHPAGRVSVTAHSYGRKVRKRSRYASNLVRLILPEVWKQHGESN
jgi:hypothetical protein